MDEKRSAELLKAIVDNVETVLLGKRDVVELTLCCLLCNGHVLIEDVPGVGKTSLASALANSFSCSFKRVQFTPDVMPSDITGFSMFNQKTGEFEYREGAVNAQIVLADEINRASPKAQSSLLEAMEERRVTVDGNTYRLPWPFLVLATQNPVDYLGTFPLPEAQLDRFLMRVAIGYPSAIEEMRILSLHEGEKPEVVVKPVATVEDLLALHRASADVRVEGPLKEYIVRLVRFTRESEHVLLGASPRASIGLFRATQAWALYNGRSYASPDDAQAMAPHVLEHRLILRQEAKLKKMTAKTVVEGALEQVEVPL